MIRQKLTDEEKRESAKRSKAKYRLTAKGKETERLLRINPKTKARRAIEQAARYSANRDKGIAQAKRWKAANPKKVKNYQSTYREEHRDEARQKAKNERLKKPERFRQSSRDNWAKNKAALKVKNAKYRRDNKDKDRLRRGRYNATHQDKLKADRKARYAANPEREKQKSAAHAKAHPEMYREYARARRAVKAGATVGERAVILKWERGWKKKSRAVCYWCQSEFPPKECETDHINPLKLKGAHAIENLYISCSKCNSKKRAQPLAAWNAQIAAPVLL